VSRDRRPGAALIDIGAIVAEPAADRVRLHAVVRAGEVAEPWWFDVPRAVADPSTDSASAWLVATLPLAAALGGTVASRSPVDPRLLENVQRILEIWRAWYPWVQPVNFDVRTSPTRNAAERRAAAFFSGGADSLFTALRPRDQALSGERTPIDELISVHGFDIPLSNTAAFDRLRERHRTFAPAIGCTLIDVATNLRETRLREVSWGWVAHGCAMAAVALCLEPHYHTVLVPATGGYRDLHPWASHPLTDPLFSTDGTEFVHDGAGHTRVEKLRLITQHERALGVLRVCWESRSDENCGRCNKCLRTMAVLECLGALGRAPTFPAHLDPAALARVRCEHSWDYREFRDLRALAASTGRPEIARAAATAMRRSRRGEVLQRARDFLATKARALRGGHPPTAERPPES
jgi:hypothetical protein